ncbi:MAG: YggS family pyridoxal phosphate-dependent enzyme [Flavobacteriales bacterium]|nr:YggS family pyridoxal phosphate-dependent enzyme [Flavobacteriales bacterium]
MSIRSNINDIKKTTPNAQLVIVTKYQNLDNIKKVYNIGEREFGENKVQDLIIKRNQLANDIKWHMIGHLQKNKVKLIAPFIYMIQSIDSIELLKIIDQNAKKYDRSINCLIQIKIAKEVSKFGFNIEEAKALLNSNYEEQYKNINIRGLMGIATFTTNKEQIKKEFQQIINILNMVKTDNPILSIGMSNDYKIAYSSGSNMIRIGSSIFK